MESIVCLVSVFFSLFSRLPCKILNTTESQAIMTQLFHNRNYISKAIPAYAGKPVVVKLAMTFSDMIPLDFFYNHIFAEVVFQMNWLDERLRYNSTVENSVIILAGENTNNIWLPDLWISNERGESSFDRFPVSQATAHLKSDGQVHYKARYSINVFCPMNYTNFPFDQQICEVLIGSYAYGSKWLNFLPYDEIGVIGFGEAFRIREFILDKKSGYDFHLFRKDYGVSGKFDHVLVRLKLKRHIYYYLMEYYIPLILVVASSWISFWIDFKCTPARATLPVTTFLTLTSIAENLRKRDAGSLSYSTVLEIFIYVSTFYVCAALIEYAIVGFVDHVMMKKVCEKKRKIPKQKVVDIKKKFRKYGMQNEHCTGLENIDIDIDPTANHLGATERGLEEREASNKEKRRHLFSGFAEKFTKKYMSERKENFNLIDQYCKVVFPLSYLAFLIVYAAVCFSLLY